MARTRATLIGDKELAAKLHRLGKAVQVANGKAARAGAKPVKDEANANAPGPHILAMQSKLNSTEDKAVVDIGPDKEHWYYQFTETGATAHEIEGKGLLAFEGRKGMVIIKKVKHPGMAAKPFLRKAMNHNRDQAQKRAGEVFLAEIDKECETK